MNTLNENQIRKISTFMSLVLRHKPQEIGLILDENGWISVEEFIYQMNAYGNTITLEILKHIVETNDKKRFAFNEDGTKIRASQGHSVSIDLDLTPQIPFDYLYHGTVNKFLESIKKEGLKKMSRQHVHLSKDKETAIKVGSRRGIPVILIVNTKQMHEDGYKFYLSENGVWLCDEVPVKYINFKN